jgi:hypothetical protein
LDRSGDALMPSPVDNGANARQAETLGLPEGLKIGSAYPFGGLNMADSRTGIDDREFSWLENYVRVGKGRMRTSYDVGPNLYQATGRKIVSFYWFAIGADTFCAVFHDDGTAAQVDLGGNSVWISSTPGTFYVAGSPPACSPWGAQYLIISNNFQPNAYWLWDGTVLYAPGTISPVISISDGGSNYSSAPTVTAVGGAGSGATFAATVENGSVVNVVPTSPGSGYGPADVVQLLFSGGGSDTGAVLQASLTEGNISAILVTNGGTGYTTVPSVSITGGAGSGATATAALAPSGVASISVLAGGVGYTSAPTVIITGGGGTGAAAVATVSGGVVTGFTVSNTGSGYTSRPTVSLSGGGGTGAAGTAALSGTSVASITVTAGGSGFTGTPTVTFSGGGGGSGAAAVATVTPGTVSGVAVLNGGSGFTGTPILEFFGGGGTGATATANVTDGVLTSVTVTNGGSGYTSVPTVEVQTGLNNAAAAVVAVMPTGVSGAAIETFQSRVWLFHPYQAGTLPSGGTQIISAPASPVDFASSDGGLLFQNTDRFLRSQYTAGRQANGALYAFGDSSVSVINNVQTAGNPPTTSFNINNTDPQIGTRWRDTLQDFSRTILFANPYGAWGVYGGSVTKVSKKLDTLFSDYALFPPDAPDALVPSSAVTEMFDQRIYLLLMTISDPLTGEERDVMLGWDETDWSVFSQTPDLEYIGTLVIDSQPQAWGTDGTTLFRLFQQPSTALKKTLQTKFFGSETSFLVERSHAIYVEAQIRADGVTTLTFDTTTVDAIGIGQPLALPGVDGR